MSSIFFFLMMRRPLRSTLFPYTTLFRSVDLLARGERALQRVDLIVVRIAATVGNRAARRQPRDRKSTRLNSSHITISYAVFCLKKKTTTMTRPDLLVILSSSRVIPRIL